MDLLQLLARDASKFGALIEYEQICCTCGSGISIYLFFAVRVFEWCVGEPVVVCGGGCADTVIAAHLRDQVGGEGGKVFW